MVYFKTRKEPKQEIPIVICHPLAKFKCTQPCANMQMKPPYMKTLYSGTPRLDEGASCPPSSALWQQCRARFLHYPLWSHCPRLSSELYSFVSEGLWSLPIKFSLDSISLTNLVCIPRPGKSFNARSAILVLCVKSSEALCFRGSKFQVHCLLFQGVLS